VARTEARKRGSECTGLRIERAQVFREVHHWYERIVGSVSPLDKLEWPQGSIGSGSCNHPCSAIDKSAATVVWQSELRAPETLHRPIISTQSLSSALHSGIRESCRGPYLHTVGRARARMSTGRTLPHHLLDQSQRFSLQNAGAEIDSDRDRR
jgi:hypothetical protein